ncbi:MAG: hypothetical protein LKJ17_07025 [Oscillospiraceae bacterium]|nr:hypothetical protein [Oscillospiraceae bacterium]
MDDIERDRKLKLWQRIPRYFEHIDVLIVRNGFGETVGVYDAKQLAQKWFASGADMFSALYGFNWIPPEQLKSKVHLHR